MLWLLQKKKSGRIAVGKTKEKCVIRESVWFRVSVLTWESEIDGIWVQEGGHDRNCERPGEWNLYFVPEILRATKRFSSWLKQIVRNLK